MSRALWGELTGDLSIDLVDDQVPQTGKVGRIEIVPEVNTQRTDGCLVSHPQSNGVRDVVVITLLRRVLMPANFRIGLMPAEQAARHILGTSKHVSHVVKNNKPNVVLNHRNGNSWKTEFEVVDEQGTAAERKAGERIAGSGLIQSEAAVRVTAS